MRIDEAVIENYKCFHMPQRVALESGFNLVVGRNSSGKSSLLEALTTKLLPSPHRSKHTIPTRRSVINPAPHLWIKLSVTREELVQLLLEWPHNLRLRLPAGRTVDHDQILQYLDSILGAEIHSFQFDVSRDAEGNEAYTCRSYPVYCSYEPQPENNGNAPMLNVMARKDRKGFTAAGLGVEAINHESGLEIARKVCQSIYRFDAQRFNVGESAIGSSLHLAPNAQNLPEVLNTMVNNSPELFSTYRDAVKKVFPEIQRIRTPIVSGQSKFQIKLWLEGTPNDREDLAVTLDQCGTGYGQVLAILYVAIQSQDPRVIIIDEPSSFLHPDAARALMRVLSTHSHHQYIVSTHSPEVISSCEGAQVFLVRWQDGYSEVHRFEKGDVASSRDALREVGARLSDLFGFDRVVWAEGPSDADCWRMLAEALQLITDRVAFLPVRDTGAFRRKELQRTLDLYRRLAFKDAWLPPSIAFLFDREGRKDAEISMLQKESRGAMHFLRRRTIENYLLDFEAIAALVREVDKERGQGIDSIAIAKWFEAKVGASKLGNSEWKQQIDAPNLLGELVSELTERRCEYRKTEHTPWLFAWNLAHNSTEIGELSETLRVVLTSNSNEEPIARA